MVLSVVLKNNLLPYQNQHRLVNVVKYDTALLFTCDTKTLPDAIAHIYLCIGHYKVLNMHFHSTEHVLWKEIPFFVHSCTGPT